MAHHNIRTRPKKPVVPAEEPKTVFTVVKVVTAPGGGEAEEAAPLPRVSVRGVHATEEQAYVAAIAELIYELEEAEGATLPKVRAIAKTATLALKDRLKSLHACQSADVAEEERVEFLIKKAHVFPEEEKMSDMDALLAGPLIPCAYWDSSDEEDYDPAAEEEDEEDDDDDEDDDVDMVNEDDAMQGIEGSEAKEAVPEKKAEEEEKKQE